MEKPTIHLNGSGAKRLHENYERVYVACFDLLGALAIAAPNGRDYYPQGNDAFKKAREEHHTRLRIVTDLRKEIEEMLNHISEWL